MSDVPAEAAPELWTAEDRRIFRMHLASATVEELGLAFKFLPF